LRRAGQIEIYPVGSPLQWASIRFLSVRSIKTFCSI
jgi:hypothetical protein